MARPDSEGPAEATDVVRPGTGVVRPGTGVVRPGGVVAPADGAAKARAVVPDAPEQPLEPIHVVLPVIEVMPAKQGFLDRLVAGKPKKTEADIAEEEAAKAAEEARKVDEQLRKADEQLRKADEQQRKADEDAWAKAEEARVKADEKSRKDAAKAEEKAREADEKAAEEARKSEEKARKADEKARRAEAKAREKALREAEDDDDEYDDYDYDDEPVAPVRAEPRALAAPPMAPPAPPRPQPAPAGRPAAPVRPAPAPAPPSRPAAPPRPQPASHPQRPPARPQYQTDPRRRPDRDGYDRGYGRDGYGYGREGRDQEPRRRPLRQWLGAAVAVLVLGTGSALVAGQAAPPAQVQWSGGIDTGRAAAVLARLDAAAKVPSTAGLAGVVNPLLADPALGGRVTASIVDVATGRSLFELDGRDAAQPASTAKLLTGAAVLHSRGPTFQIPTRVVAGSAPGEVVLIGGGDPTLAAGGSPTYPGAARLDVLADQVRKALGTATPTRVTIDTTIYAGDSKQSSWFDIDLNGGIIARVTALMTDGARVNPAQTSQVAPRYTQPDLAAGQIFAGLLGLPPEVVSYGPAPAGAKQLGQVLSPTIARLVEIMLAESDNVIAEGLARQVALARNVPASFEGGASATRAALSEIGVASDGLGLVDGSGLSNDNRVSAAQLTSVLAAAASTKFPELRSIITGLPVAAYSGTLAARYHGARDSSGAGIVRAKTGTLSGVNALAGLAVDADGRLLAFSMVADMVGDGIERSNNAVRALDRVAVAIAACGC